MKADLIFEGQDVKYLMGYLSQDRIEIIGTDDSVLADDFSVLENLLEEMENLLNNKEGLYDSNK